MLQSACQGGALCEDWRMDRAAMSPVSQGGGEAPVSAEAPPWQGGLLSDDACRGVMQ